MATVQVLKAIAILIGSFIVGFIFFYSTSPLAKSSKKKLFDEMTSLLINFVIFIWVAKIVLNFNLFIKDPFAVLAYPSNSNAFYLASLFIIINVWYKVIKHKFKPETVLIAFVPIFLVSSFVFEFIQIVWVKSAYSWIYLVLLMMLVCIYALLHDRLSSVKLTSNLMLAWSLGTLVLSLTLPFTSVFGYTVSSWYLIFVSILLLVLMMYNLRKKGY